MLTPFQCRVTRAALQIGVREPAQRVGVATMMMTRFEDQRANGGPVTPGALCAALMLAGMDFIEESGG